MKAFSHRKSANLWATFGFLLTLLFIAAGFASHLPGATGGSPLYFPTLWLTIVLSFATTSIIRALAPPQSRS